jgi:hypothetical protein
LVIVGTSPEGTRVITMGLVDEPRSPAATVGMPSSLLQTAGGVVAVGPPAVGAAVAAVVLVAAGAVVLVAAAAVVLVAAGALVGATVGGATVGGAVVG